MERYTDEYRDYVQQIAYQYPSAPYIAVEKQVDYSYIAPEGFGTADCIMMGFQAFGSHGKAGREETV